MVELEDKKLRCFAHWEGQLPRFVNDLRKWGEVGIIKLHRDTTPNIYDRGTPCMLVSYCLNHAGDTKRVWDPDIKHVHLSCKIVWTGRL
jgi:hypothetical protein